MWRDSTDGGAVAGDWEIGRLGDWEVPGSNPAMDFGFRNSDFQTFGLSDFLQYHCPYHAAACC